VAGLDYEICDELVKDGEGVLEWWDWREGGVEELN